MKEIVFGVCFVFIAYAIGWVRRTVRYVRLQNLLSEDFFNFTSYIHMGHGDAEGWEISYDKNPGDLKLVYRSPVGGYDTIYLRNTINRLSIRGIDKLIDGYHREFRR